MSNRADACSQYMAAWREGKKYYSAHTAKGEDPYLPVLEDQLTDAETAGTLPIGLMEIPMRSIVGTWAAGRKTSFAGNFMPLLDDTTEFAGKWISLCAAHLGSTGITDPITCYEYLGKFYVREGHKRVSVLRTYGAPTIQGIVTRIIPAPSENPEIRRYYEFMRFFKASHMYQVTFSKPDGYARLQAALGFEPDQAWSTQARVDFTADFERFTRVYTQINAGEKLSLTAGDAFLACLQVYPYSELKDGSEDSYRKALTALLPDLRLMDKGEPISVSDSPQEKEKGLLSRILGGPRLHAAFVYNRDPQQSAWISAHDMGRKYAEEKLGDSVTISTHICGEDPDATLEEAVSQGANVIFAAVPSLIDACRRLAAKYKNVAVYICSLSMPYAEVRSYYCRIYECKFISGAIAGAMAPDGRIGYVANYPIMGSAAAINAFALGAQMTNPRAVISLKWSCVDGNPQWQLQDEKITVISSRDEDGASPYLAWHMGTYQVTPGGTPRLLASPRWNWGVFYEKSLRSLLNGGIESLRDSKHAVNDWWGLRTGMVDVVLDDSLPEGIKQLAGILKQGILDEKIDPFLRPLRDRDGNIRSDGKRVLTPEELMRMDWLCENVEGKIPAFEELMPRSRDLVRVLGVYRDTIPPETEEPAL